MAADPMTVVSFCRAKMPRVFVIFQNTAATSEDQSAEKGWDFDSQET